MRRTEAGLLTNLADLAAPLSESDFIALLHQRTPLIQRGAGRDRYRTLIDWDGFLKLVTSGTFPSQKLTVTRAGGKVPRAFFADGDAIRASGIERLMSTGASLIAYGVEPFIPALAALCNAVAAQTGERVSGGLIATTGSGGALPLHYDEEDIVILQIEGRKRWIVQPDPVPWPVLAMTNKPGPPEVEPLIDEILDPGDFLFLPGGYRDRCENQGQASLHAGILFRALSAPRAFELLARAMAEKPQDREWIRFDPADAGAAEAMLKAKLIERIASVSMAELIERHRAES